MKHALGGRLVDCPDGNLGQLFGVLGAFCDGQLGVLDASLDLGANGLIALTRCFIGAVTFDLAFDVRHEGLSLFDSVVKVYLQLRFCCSPKWTAEPAIREPVEDSHLKRRSHLREKETRGAMQNMGSDAARIDRP